MNKVHLQLAGRVKIHNCDETNRNIDAVNDARRCRRRCAKTTTMSSTMRENHDVVDDARKPQRCRGRKSRHSRADAKLSRDGKAVRELR